MLILQQSGWRMIGGMVVGPWGAGNINTVGANLLVLVKGTGPVTGTPPTPSLVPAIRRNMVPTHIEIWFTYHPARPTVNIAVSEGRAMVLTLAGRGGPRSGTNNFVGQATANGNIMAGTTTMTVTGGATPPRLRNALFVSAVSRVVGTTEVTVPNYNVEVVWDGGPGYINISPPEISLAGVAGDADRTGMAMAIWWRAIGGGGIQARWGWSQGSAVAVAGAQFPLP